jgi:hypothetical protein
MNNIEMTCLFAVLAIPYIRLHSRNRDGGWHPHWWTNKMRRKAMDGSWQYRARTSADADHYGDVGASSW